MIPRIKLVFFDLDGTLVDSAVDIAKSANHVLAFHGLPLIPQEQVRHYIGNGLRSFIEKLAPHKKDDLEFIKTSIAAFHEHYASHLLKNTHYFEGVEEFFDYWPYQMAIVTNKNEVFARQIIQGLKTPFSRFVDIIGGDRFHLKKPDPIQINDLLHRTGVHPSQAVLVGDSTQDLRAAHAAGIHSISVTFGYNTVEQLRASGAKFFIHHWSELPHLLPIEPQ
jgi:phosphoglycolate phosphatase